MTAGREGSKTEDAALIGIVADPRLPTRLAHRVADRLSDRAATELGHPINWEFDVVTRDISIDGDGDIPIVRLGRRGLHDRNYDVRIVITDMTRRIDDAPVTAEYSGEQSTILLSVPSLGAVGLGRRGECALLDLLIGHLYPDRQRPRLKGPLERVREGGGDSGSSEQLALRGYRGRARMLAGMVRANRPWFLVPQLAPALAGATAGAAFGVFYSNIWVLADALSPGRLGVIGLLAIAGMALWLILDHSLWEQPAKRRLREEVAMFNTSTVITITTAVLCMYALLYVALLMAVAIVIPPDYLASTLKHSVGFVDYARLAWLCVSMGTLAGAVGSGLASEDAVRAATFSSRAEERRREIGEEEDDEDNTTDENGG